MKTEQNEHTHPNGGQAQIGCGCPPDLLGPLLLPTLFVSSKVMRVAGHLIPGRAGDAVAHAGSLLEAFQSRRQPWWLIS